MSCGPSAGFVEVSASPRHVRQPDFGKSGANFTPDRKRQPRLIRMSRSANSNSDEPLAIRLGRSRRERIVHVLFYIALEEEIVWFSGAEIASLEDGDVYYPRASVIPAFP